VQALDAAAEDGQLRAPGSPVQRVEWSGGDDAADCELRAVCGVFSRAARAPTAGTCTRSPGCAAAAPPVRHRGRGPNQCGTNGGHRTPAWSWSSGRRSPCVVRRTTTVAIRNIKANRPWTVPQFPRPGLKHLLAQDCQGSPGPRHSSLTTGPQSRPTLHTPRALDANEGYGPLQFWTRWC
jgi:hypothetical protein